MHPTPIIMCYAVALKLESRIEQVTKLLDKLEFVFVPIVNPDGYKVYTFSTF